ncbi:fungal-specific transcription factor domain-containing protein [Aspergillus carlsbadensis]|nr:fungal-specific transcription factor domain-containing protein [Aspergillus carlsbadensis]
MQHRRSRDECWTCRRRKKKCDGTDFPCGTCSRLGLPCERDTRLVWEDDARREAMRRRARGLPRRESPSDRMGKCSAPENIAESAASKMSFRPRSVENPKSLELSLVTVSAWPFQLDATESALLDHYIQRFSNTYPTFSGPESPFLTVLLPLSTRSRVVLNSLLALSGVQTWQNGSFGMGEGMLKMRQRALRGCRMLLMRLYRSADVLSQSTIFDTTPFTRDNVINLFASCMLLLLYEKLAGEGEENWSPHLSFIASLCSHAEIGVIPSRDEAFQFLISLFSYNDLVRSTSLQAPTMSDFYLRGTSSAMPQHGSTVSRFTFPSLIARISAGDTSVTDADIAAWDGKVNWFPSFALVSTEGGDPEYLRSPTFSDGQYIWKDPLLYHIEQLLPSHELTDDKIISRLYRIAAMVYRRQKGIDRLAVRGYCRQMALWAVQLLRLLPAGSAFETTLLWPIGIVARELTLADETQRAYLIYRLEALEHHFHMKHFSCVKDFLLSLWVAGDYGLEDDSSSVILLG